MNFFFQCNKSPGDRCLGQPGILPPLLEGVEMLGSVLLLWLGTKKAQLLKERSSNDWRDLDTA
jgi:hypothetical protein